MTGLGTRTGDLDIRNKSDDNRAHEYMHGTRAYVTSLAIFVIETSSFTRKDEVQQTLLGGISFNEH